MISLDTNILLYALNEDCPECTVARGILSDLGACKRVVICELVLVELYLLLRNPVVLARPLSAPEAVEICRGFRDNPSWSLVGCADVMDGVWSHASDAGFARRRIIDARLALTLRHHGVTELITRNSSDFEGFGFERVWSPF